MRLYPGYMATVRTALVGAVLAGYLLALALASSPELHDAFHHDASQSNHACLATILHAGQSEPVVVVVMAAEPAAAPIAKVLLGDEEIAESCILRCRLQQRGPPILLLS